MANGKESSTKSSSIKSWIKVAGGSAKSAFKDYMSNSVMPITSEMTRELKEAAKDVKDKSKQSKPRKQADIFNLIMQSPMAKQIKRIAKEGWTEVKRGNIFMVGANGSDDDTNNDPFTDSEETSGGTIFGDGNDNNTAMMSGYDEIGDRISDQTEATYKSAELNMNATVMSSSAIIESQEKIGADIVSRLDNLNASITNIGTKQSTMMEKFFEAVTKGLDRMGVAEQENQPNQIPSNDAIFKTSGGKKRGVNISSYKSRVIQNIQKTMEESGNGSVGFVKSLASVLIDNGTPESLMQLLTTELMAKVFENNIGKLGTKIESVVADGIPRVIMDLTDMGNNPNSSKFARIIGKILGVDLKADLNKPEVKFEGKGIPFDDQTKAAIVNVIPKHLSEISEYTRLLAKKVLGPDENAVNEVENVKNKALTFDMNDGRYKTREDLTKEVFGDYYNKFFDEMRNSELGRGLQSVADMRKSYINGDTKAGKKAIEDIQSSYDSVLKQIAMYLYSKNNEGVNLRDTNRLEELGQLFAKNGANSDQVKQLVNEVKTLVNQQSVINDMASLRLNLYDAGAKAQADIKNNPNLVDTLITDSRYKDMDMLEAMQYLIGSGPNVYKASSYRDRSNNTNTQTTRRPYASPYGSYRRIRTYRYDRPDRGVADNPAAIYARLTGAINNRNNTNDEDVVHFNNIQQSEESAVNELLGTTQRFATQDTSRSDRMGTTINRFGASGKAVFKRIVNNVVGSGTELSNAILHGDVEAIAETVLGAVAGSALFVGDFIKKSVLTPAADFIFGKKDTNGYRKDGILSGVSNSINDIMQSVAARIDGKEWTDRNGKIHRPDDPNDSILGKAKAALTNTVNSFKKIFTDDNENQNDQNGTVVNSIRAASNDLFSSAKRNLDQLLYGEGFEDLTDDEKKAKIKETRENIKKRTIDGIKGSIAGVGVSAILGTTALPRLLSRVTVGGLLGNGVIASAILNPVVGAGIGFTLGFLNKSESFHRFFFGGEYTDKNGNKQWREGLISRKMQAFFEKNKTTIGVSGAIGAGAAMLSGSKMGLLGSILGGPLAGASIGITTALVAKSNAFHTFLFGDPEKGISGIKQQWARLFKDSNNNMPSITASGLKAIGFSAAGGGASLLLDKFGLIPSLISNSGPLGVALLGMVGGATLAHKDLKKLLFGEDFVNEDGEIERKEGIIGKFTNALKVSLVQPVGNVAKSVIRSINYEITHRVLAPLRVAFYPFAKFTKKLMSNITKVISGFGKKIGKGIDEYLFNPMKMFVKAITRPLARSLAFMGNMVKGVVSIGGRLFSGSVGLASRLASLSMTDDEKREWRRQRELAKEQRETDKKTLKEENELDKLANKDRAKILKYTDGDYGDDTAEARRVAERRAKKLGKTLTWNNETPRDGWYIGRPDDPRNKFDRSIPILSSIRTHVGDILTFLKSHITRKKNNNPTVGHAEGIDKVPEGQDYVANENSTGGNGARELISFPKANGKGRTIIEGKKGSFVVRNGGGEKVYNGTEEMPIPVLVSAYSQTALDQRDGLNVKVSEIDDEANKAIQKDTKEAINKSDASNKKSIPDKFKEYSVLFGKSIFGPDWEPKDGGFYDILTGSIGNALGAVITPIIGAAKAIVTTVKAAKKIVKFGWNIIKAPFKLGKWLFGKAVGGIKKGVGFVKDHIISNENGKLSIGGTIKNIAIGGKDKLVDTASTIHGNRKYAKIRKLIVSGDSLYKNKFDVYEDEDGREHIVAKEDVTLNDGTTVKEGQELKDAIGAANILKRTENIISGRAKRRLENEQANVGDSESDNASLEDADPGITASLVPTNNILENILESVNSIRNKSSKDETDDENASLPKLTNNQSISDKVGEDKPNIPGVSDLLGSNNKSDNGTEENEGSAKVVKASKEEEEKSQNIENRENENNSALKQLADNSEDAKKTRKSWFGKNGKLMKILGIGAIALFALYKFIGGNGLKSLLSNIAGAVLGSGKQLIGDTLYGLDNLTDQNDIATNIKETDSIKVAADSVGGFGLKTRAFSVGLNAILKTGSGGIKAGGKALLDSFENGTKALIGWKNPFTQIKTSKKSSMNALSKAASKSMTNHLDKAAANLTAYASKAEANGAKTVSTAFKDFVTGIIKKAGGEAAETAAENATKSGVFKELLEAIKVKSAKIMAKVSGSKFAKGVAAVLSFGLSEAGFAVLGAINGVTGAARLFHVDEEDVDPLMMAISAGMGAFTSTFIGSIMDAAASIIAETTGLDLLCEVASFVYRLLGDDTKIDTAREKFRAGYEEYKDDELRKQYETYMIANSKTVGSDYTYEDYLADVESGAKSAKLDSEITYNKKKNKSFFDKAGDKFTGAFRKVSSIAKDVGTGIFGDTEIVYVDNENEVIYRQQGQQWFAYKWTGKTLISIGLVDEDNIPNSAISVKCKISSWLNNEQDEVNELPTRFGWSPWRPGQVTDKDGNVITNEVDVVNPSSTVDENGFGGGGGKLYDTTGPRATLEFKSDVPYYFNNDESTIQSITDADNYESATYATIMRDSKLSEVFGNTFKKYLSEGKTADELAEMNYFNPYNTEDDLKPVDASALNLSADEFREYLKDYALYIKDWDTGEYTNGFFLVHPNENSFIRFTMAGNLFSTGYDWTGVLSAWISGNLVSKKITNYHELINSLKDDGVTIDTVDPDEIAKEDEDNSSIFDMIGKAFSSIFSAFNKSWKRLMTGEEVDEVMEITESNWVDKVYGKKIVRPISEDGSKPTKKGFKAASFLFYVLDSSKKYFIEYNLFNIPTGMEVPIEVVKNWVKSSEAWIDNSDDGKVSYSVDGTPMIESIDPSKLIYTYQVSESKDGLLTLTKEANDGEYTNERRKEIAEEAKGSFDGYTRYIDTDKVSNLISKDIYQSPRATLLNRGSSKGGFGRFSNKTGEELDKRFSNIKTATIVSNANARAMSNLISADDAATTEAVNTLNSKNREEEVRKHFSEMVKPTEVLMAMDGTYWVWDRTNTFRRYTYFGQDLVEELNNDEMMALYKSGRYLVKTKPLSSINRMNTILTGNLSTISSNFDTNLSSVSNSISYSTNYTNEEASGSNIYTTGSTSSGVSTTGTTSNTTSTSSKTSSVWDTVKSAASKASSAVSNLIGSLTSKKSSTTNATKKKIRKKGKISVAKGGFGDILNGVPYYSQNDSRWKNNDYSGVGDNATMGDAGCGPAVLSMVDNFYGGKESPLDYARLAQETGYRDESGTNWEFISNATKAMGLNTNQIENPDSLDIASQLSTGQPVILSGTRTLNPNESPYTTAGHYVVATGMNPNGTVNISDPRGRGYSKAFSLDKLASETGSMWGFGGKGGFGKVKKAIKDRLNKKKGGRGKFSADEARKVMLQWISSVYQRVDYVNVSAQNMDAAAQGTGRGKADCSSLQQWLYRRAMGVEIGRDTRSQATNGYPTVDRSNGATNAMPNFAALKPGDLIYFCRLDGDINNPGVSMCHVEMYIGNTHSLGIGSPTTPGSRLMDVKNYIETGSAATCRTPQKYWGTKRIIQDNKSYDMNVPDPSWIKFDTNNFSSISGPSGSSTDSSTATVSTASNKTKDFFEVFGSLMSEVGNRYAQGVASGNFDTDFTAAFDEILNGGSTSLASGNSSSGNNTGVYNGDYIGKHVKRFESGSKGPRSRASCGNDWGMSYGSYALTLRWGNVIKFLKKYYPDLAKNLFYIDGHDVSTNNYNAVSRWVSSPNEVSQVWDAALNQNETKFFENEHQYIADNFYTPARNSINGFDPDKHSRAAQEAIWSWAVRNGGVRVGMDFPKLGLSNPQNASTEKLLNAIYNFRYNNAGSNEKPRYAASGNTGSSERATLLALGNQTPLNGLIKSDTAKGGFGDTKKLKNSIKKSSGNTVHVTNDKAKQSELDRLANIQAMVNSTENIIGDTKVVSEDTIPGSNGVKQSEIKSNKGGYGVYRSGGRGDTNEVTNGSTAEKALNKLVSLVEAIVEYVSQSNNKLDYLKDIKNQQVVVKEGDKNIAIANPNVGSSNDTYSTNSKSIGRVLAEILASG